MQVTRTFWKGGRKLRLAIEKKPKLASLEVSPTLGTKLAQAS
jgi:hypothetical protein